jgi:serine/threonine-protein kinase HipA
LTECILHLKDTVGKVREQFFVLGEKAGIPKPVVEKTISLMTNHNEQLIHLISQSFLSNRLKRNNEQAYLTKLKKLMRAYCLFFKTYPDR